MSHWLEEQLKQWPIWGLLVFIALDLLAIVACIHILVDAL